MVRINPEKFMPPAPDEVVENTGAFLSDIGDMAATILENNPLTLIGKGMRRFNSDIRRRF